MTKNIDRHYKHIQNYKKARDQVLEHIKQNRPQVPTAPINELFLSQNQVIDSPDGDRYKIVQYLGEGTFGQVVKCLNMKTGKSHAIKIIKNKEEYTIQGLVEIKILDKLINDPYRSEFEKKHLINMQDYFVFKDFLCIVFECLNQSLYDILSKTDKGLSLQEVREYLRQILEALITFKEANLIHCDLKPENIMVEDDLKTVKLIDLGSAAFNGHHVYTYIQSRYYRAPEVLMGCYKEN